QRVREEAAIGVCGSADNSGRTAGVGMKRDKQGKFAVRSFCYIDDKGYPRISAGPMRGQRLHRIIAAAKLGRPLRPDEDVHHLDGDKLNFAPGNLQVL